VAVHVSLKNTKAVLHEQLVWFSFITEENGHSEHFVAAVRENVLFLQVSHSMSPPTGLTLPGPHPTHLPVLLVYPAAHTHAVAMLISFLAHKTIVPSLSEIGSVVRSTSCSIGKSTVLLATLANASAFSDKIMISVLYPDCCSRFLEAAVKMTCTKLSEMLYCEAMLLVICCINESIFEEVFVIFDVSKLMKPLSRTPSL
jgi:hypothetical protein